MIFGRSPIYHVKYILSNFIYLQIYIYGINLQNITNIIIKDILYPKTALNITLFKVCHQSFQEYNFTSGESTWVSGKGT